MEHTAAIFDMDGVIVDSGPWHLQAWRTVLQRHNVIANDVEFRHLFGMRDSEVVPHLIGMYSDDEVKVYAEEKSQVFKEYVHNHATPTVGIVNFIDRLHAHDIQTALASLATPEEIDIILEVCGLQDRLNIVVTGAQSMRDKPAPDIFLTAAFRLGVTPQETVVFEDAISGVEAARSAGAATIAITTSYAPGELSHADVVINDFTDPKLSQFFDFSQH